VNISGAKSQEKVRPATAPKQVQRGGNRNLMKMRLVSQQDDATEGEEGAASPRVRETTEGNDSLGCDAKGQDLVHGLPCHLSQMFYACLFS
jgi:hypothetical protein